MFNYTLLNQVESFPIDLIALDNIYLSIAEVVPLKQKGILNIAFLPDEDIRALNKQYRDKDKSTDVLSFHYVDDFEATQDEDVIGEIILSESYILTQAQEHGHTPEKEFQILVIHGTLHILGFDHETDEEYEEMSKYESKLRNGLV